MIEKSLLPDIEEYVKRFETGAYNSLSDRYLHYLFIENQKFRESMEGRDKKIVELLRECGELRKQKGNNEI